MDRNEIIKFYAVAPSPKKYFNQQYSFMDYLQKEMYIKLKKWNAENLKTTKGMQVSDMQSAFTNLKGLFTCMTVLIYECCSALIYLGVKNQPVVDQLEYL